MMNFKKIIFSTAIFGPLLGVAQSTFTENGIVYTEDLSDPSKLAVIVVAKKSPMVMEGLSAYEGDIVIPSKVKHDLDEYAVVGIGQGAFFGCEDLESLIIEDGPTKIMMNTIVAKPLTKMIFPNTMKSIAGFYPGDLEEVSFGNSLQKVENSSFGNIETLEFPNTLKKLELIYTVAPDINSYRLKNLTLGSNMDYIKMSFSFFAGEKLDMKGCKLISQSFGFCENLTDLNLGDGVQTIDNSFNNLGNLENLKIPASCKTITSSFATTPLLQELELGEGIETIHYSFRKTEKLKKLTLPKNVKNISESFSSLPEIEELILPDGLKEIKDSFRRLYAVKKLTIPSSVKLIDDSFLQLSALEELTIDSPDVVLKGGALGAEKLKVLTVSWIVPPTKPSFITGSLEGTIYVPKGTVEAYIEAWKLARAVERGNVKVLEK